MVAGSVEVEAALDAPAECALEGRLQHRLDFRAEAHPVVGVEDAVAVFLCRG